MKNMRHPDPIVPSDQPPNANNQVNRPKEDKSLSWGAVLLILGAILIAWGVTIYQVP